MDAEERNGKRRRQRQTEKIANAVEAVTRALEPLDAEARGRVVRAAAALLEVDLNPPMIQVERPTFVPPKEGL